MSDNSDSEFSGPLQREDEEEEAVSRKDKGAKARPKVSPRARPRAGRLMFPSKRGPSKRNKSTISSSG